MAKAEGREFDFDGPEAVRVDLLETFDFDSPEQKVRYDYPEFNAVCPFSGLPDIAKVSVIYYPNGKALELKSLKYYYVSYRNVGLYQEPVTKKIYEDLKKVLGTERIQVKTIYNTRGGIDTTCVEGSY